MVKPVFGKGTDLIKQREEAPSEKPFPILHLRAYAIIISSFQSQVRHATRNWLAMSTVPSLARKDKRLNSGGTVNQKSDLLKVHFPTSLVPAPSGYHLVSAAFSFLHMGGTVRRQSAWSVPGWWIQSLRPIPPLDLTEHDLGSGNEKGGNQESIRRLCACQQVESRIQSHTLRLVIHWNFGCTSSQAPPRNQPAFRVNWEPITTPPILTHLHILQSFHWSTIFGSTKFRFTYPSIHMITSSGESWLTDPRVLCIGPFQHLANVAVGCQEADGEQTRWTYPGKISRINSNQSRRWLSQRYWSSV